MPKQLNILGDTYRGLGNLIWLLTGLGLMVLSACASEPPIEAEEDVYASIDEVESHVTKKIIEKYREQLADVNTRLEALQKNDDARPEDTTFLEEKAKIYREAIEDLDEIRQFHESICSNHATMFSRFNEGDVAEISIFGDSELVSGLWPHWDEEYAWLVMKEYFGFDPGGELDKEQFKKLTEFWSMPDEKQRRVFALAEEAIRIREYLGIDVVVKQEKLHFPDIEEGVLVLHGGWEKTYPFDNLGFQLENFRKLDTEKQKILVEEKRRRMETLQPARLDLFIAIRERSWETVKRLIGADQKLVTVTDDDEWTALHWAAAEGWNDLVAFLLKKNAAVNAKRKSDGTPLHEAARYDRTKAVVLLLEKEAAVNATAKGGVTPLHLAAQKGHEEIVKNLINKGADVNAIDELNSTALIWASFFGNPNVVTLLLENKADVNAMTTDGATALYSAVLTDQKDIVDLLLAKGALWKGITPLHWAAQQGDVATAEDLIADGADVNAKDIGGATPLFWVARGNHTDFAKLLLKHGADVNAKTKDGGTSLHQAVLLALLQKKVKPSKRMELIQLLLDNGAQVDARGSLKSISFGGDAKTYEGMTPLYVAVYMGSQEAVKILLENGADAKTRTKEGYTPLHMLAIGIGPRGEEGKEIIKMLMENGADMRAKTKDGKTPLDLALENDLEETAELLRKQGGE